MERRVQEASGDGREHLRGLEAVTLTPYGGWQRSGWAGEHPAMTWASALHRTFTLQATGVTMANARYELMRVNAMEEMRRVLGVTRQKAAYFRGAGRAADAA